MIRWILLLQWNYTIKQLLLIFFVLSTHPHFHSQCQWQRFCGGVRRWRISNMVIDRHIDSRHILTNVWLVVRCLTALSAWTGSIVLLEHEIYCVKRGMRHRHNKTIHYTEQVISALRPGLCWDNLLTTNRLPQRSLSSQSLGKYWQLNQNNQETEHIQIQTNGSQKVALINSKKHTQKNSAKRQHRQSLV